METVVKKSTQTAVRFALKAAISNQHRARQVVGLCKRFHEIAREMAAGLRLKSAEKRHVYVTPGSYLTLLATFRTLLRSERSKMDEARKRRQAGVRQLEATSSLIFDLR